MGQCSTLPTEAKNDSSGGAQERDDRASTHHRYRTVVEHTMTDTSDNSTTPLTAKHSKRPSGYHLQVQTEKQGVQPSGHYTQTGYRYEEHHSAPPPNNHHYHHYETQQPVVEECQLPPPPESAVRTRCYQLNLESDFVGVNSADAHGHVLGPFAQQPPGLTYSASDDSTASNNSTTVAVQTAQIFRGISVAQDGTILAQNARATRSSRGNKVKKGEKSRQAAKIDKAKDLVEETILTGKAPDSDKDAKMESLVIMGEYDEMRYLVRDGSRKLRDANGLPDEALLARNRIRGFSESDLPRSPLSPSRKRVSPHFVNTGSPYRSSSPVAIATNRHYTGSPRGNRPPLPQSAPPKLKGHPRDRPSSRRLNSDEPSGSRQRRFLPVHDPCNNMFPPPEGDSDWSGALGFSRGFNSIWNCGGTGTTSPTQNVNGDNKGGYHHPHSAPHSPVGVAIDVRNDASPTYSHGGTRITMTRGRAESERVEPPGHHTVRVLT